MPNKIFVFIIATFCMAGHIFATTASFDIIPIPRHITPGNDEFVVDGLIRVYCNLSAKEMKSFSVSLKELPFEWKIEKNIEKSDIVFFKQSTQKKVDNVSESYILNITKNRIEIRSSSETGLFYGLQSIRQLIRKNKLNQYSVSTAEISDSPRFSYRGFMLDVSRHFFSVEFVKKQIDMMAYYKLNRLHLHLTDAAGWRIEIKKYPRLTEYSAWRPDQNWKKWWNGNRKYVNFDNDSASGGFYSQNDIRELVIYAQKRHIVIIPEIEMPAHSEETKAAYPFLACQNSISPNGDLCAGNDSTYRFLNNVLKEVISLFPSEYIHIGGDEAGKAGWRSCPRCKSLMEQENLTNLDDLQAYFVGRIAGFLHSKKRKIIGWDEITEGKIPVDAMIMSWRNESGALNAIKTGNRAIMTPGEFCYFDAYQDAPQLQPEAIGGFLPLEKVYSYNPTLQIPSESISMVAGVQANLWTEYVPTPEHAETMIYPRLLALSEVGWSDPAQKSWPDFRLRALSAVEFMKAKGYHTFDLKNEFGNRINAQNFVAHKAVGKKVSYIGNFSNAYPAGGSTALVDGNCGGWSYADKRWQGFIGSKRLEVVIDLDSIQSVGNIQMCFMQSVGAEVYLPVNVEYSISDDGEHFSSLYLQTNRVNTAETIQYKDVIWNGNVRGRFVKVKATATPEFGGWVFADEIIVK